MYCVYNIILIWMLTGCLGQVECKRAEPRDAQALLTEAPGMMMLAQAPDGTVGLVPAQQAAGSTLICPPGAELGGAYRTLAPEMMQSAVQGKKFYPVAVCKPM